MSKKRNIRKRSRRRKDNQRKPVPWYKSNSFGTIIIITTLGYFLWGGVKKTYDNILLAKYGITTTGVVTEIKIGVRSIINNKYKFFYKGNLYYGDAYEDDYKAGDSIKIIFLKDNPEISAFYGHIYNNAPYNWFIPKK
ncbi:MAG: hypothetical protein ACM34K_00610 [Bacillota bacterium]